MKKIFIEGAISPAFIADSIAKHQTKTGIGAHQLFLGQVRADEIDGKIVNAIEYSAHTELAEIKMHEIREKTFELYDLSCMHIYHSLGRVEKGEICLFVFVSSRHRNQVNEAIIYLVEKIKEQLPIFGKEVFEDGSHVWKQNTLMK